MKPKGILSCIRGYPWGIVHGAYRVGTYDVPVHGEQGTCPLRETKELAERTHTLPEEDRYRSYSRRIIENEICCRHADSGPEIYMGLRQQTTRRIK